jgi:hypothetical protein
VRALHFITTAREEGRKGEGEAEEREREREREAEAERERGRGRKGKATSSIGRAFKFIMCCIIYEVLRQGAMAAYLLKSNSTLAAWDEVVSPRYVSFRIKSYNNDLMPPPRLPLNCCSPTLSLLSASSADRLRRLESMMI